MDGSWELLFHSLSLPTPFLLSSSLPTLKPILSPARWERAIGVIYRPDTEKQSHYFKAKLGSQFDFVIHVDVTNGVVPLEKVGKWTADEVEETFPTGL